MLGCTIIIYFYLPETKGRSPAEIDEMFEARVPARKWKCKFYFSRHFKATLLMVYLAYVCSTATENFLEGTADAKLKIVVSHSEVRSN